MAWAIDRGTSQKDAMQCRGPKFDRFGPRYRQAISELRGKIAAGWLSAVEECYAKYREVAFDIERFVSHDSGFNEVGY
jgi:hypothetical protein